MLAPKHQLDRSYLGLFMPFGVLAWRKATHNVALALSNIEGCRIHTDYGFRCELTSIHSSRTALVNGPPRARAVDALGVPEAT